MDSKIIICIDVCVFVCVCVSELACLYFNNPVKFLEEVFLFEGKAMFDEELP